MNERDELYQYPFWTPETSGNARDFARPVGIPSIQLQAISDDALRLRVPSEIEYFNGYTRDWQWNPIIIPSPQAPVQVPDQFVRANSLLEYASMTLGGSDMGGSSFAQEEDAQEGSKK